MPNRILKESIRTSDEINELSPLDEILFYRLIVSADDFGRFDGRIKIINSTCFPLRDYRDSDIRKSLDKLSAVGLVELYEVQGRPVLQLVTWERHQQVRAKKSKYPSKEEACKTDGFSKLQSSDINCNQMISSENKCPRNPIQSESESKSESEYIPPTPSSGDGEVCHAGLSQADTVRVYGFDPELEQAVLDWINYKSEKRQPYKDKGLNALLKQIEKNAAQHGSSVVSGLINECMANNWQGIIWDRINKPVSNTARYGQDRIKTRVSEVDGW